MSSKRTGMYEKPRSTVRRYVRGVCCLIHAWSSDVQLPANRRILRRRIFKGATSRVCCCVNCMRAAETRELVIALVGDTGGYSPTVTYTAGRNGVELKLGDLLQSSKVTGCSRI